ncbi:MAG: hypothetical protein LH632_21005, partial [Rhodoferax sp.]|nr:hypothetical protein [Rhodoferax sp.]
TTTGAASGWSWVSQAVAQPAGGQGGGFAVQRERLVTGLKLNQDQQDKLDAIWADMRPKFMAVRELAEAERGAARAKLTGEMQQRINAMLKPDQRALYEQMQARATAGAAAGAGSATVALAASAAVGPAVVSAAADTATGTSSARTARTPGAGASAAPGGPAARAPAVGAAAGGAASGAGGPLAEFRNRVVAELQLTPDQAAKVDALFAAARPRFMGLRDVAQEDRPKARERILADLRASIGDVLTAEQKPKYVALLAEAGGRVNTRGRIYLMGEDGKPKAFNVRLGITDGSSTELLVAAGGPNAAELKEGALVIIGIQGGSAASPGGAPRPPSGPRLPF